MDEEDFEAQAEVIKAVGGGALNDNQVLFFFGECRKEQRSVNFIYDIQQQPKVVPRADPRTNPNAKMFMGTRNYHYRCRKCGSEFQFATQQNAGGEYILEHVEAHHVGQIAIYRNMNTNLVYADFGKNETQAGPINKPWQHTSTKKSYKFIKNVFPERWIQQDGETFVCHVEGCGWRKHFPNATSDVKCRAGVANKFIKHAKTCGGGKALPVKKRARAQEKKS